MPKSKRKTRQNHRQPSATVHLPRQSSLGETPHSMPSQNMYVRRSTLKFDDEEKWEEETVTMWDDDLLYSEAFMSEIVPYGIKQSDFEPGNVHFKQIFNQKDLLNEKVDAWKKIAEEAKRHMERKETMTGRKGIEYEMENDTAHVDIEADTSVTTGTIVNVQIATETNASGTDEPFEDGNAGSCFCCSCYTDFDHNDGVKCCSIQTGISLPCFIVVVIIAVLIFPLTFVIALLMFFFCCPIMKIFETRKNSRKQASGNT
ncbi:uncharacterized protein LOC117111205 [Anneissia japonica]|uniref:uncharacterized protein LOC117111205 n=1 Tax=Anneissia japonica TaxID=1529436 RepID=UPI001425B23A|nr:uncharacterized protein LOC117111205 [Anneissia japonica]